MGDQIHVSPGSPPWRPTDDSEIAETFSYYDAPLFGLIRQHGQTFAFRCLFGHVEKWSIWLYVHVHGDEVERMLQGNPEEALQFIVTQAPRHMVLSFANEEEGIVASELVRPDTDKQFDMETLIAPDHIVRTEITQLLNEYRRYREEEKTEAIG